MSEKKRQSDRKYVDTWISAFVAANIIHRETHTHGVFGFAKCMRLERERVEMVGIKAVNDK